MQQTFIDKCLSGDAFLDEIDDYIDAWHDEATSDEIELHTYLGMTWEEYCLWVNDSTILGSIINAKRKNINIFTELEQEIPAIAARADSQEEAEKMMIFLKNL